MDQPKNEKYNKKVLTEIPEDLKRLTLILVKNFYGPDLYVVCLYIQKKIIVKEDELRDICKIDQRQMRKILTTLKVDKIVKERLIPEEEHLVDGKLRKLNYLFINYRAVINVAKYKIDHIRQKLEVREKDDVHKAHYRCTGENCKRQYDAMDIGQIYDPFTQEMRCWQCKAIVEPDESGGPSTITRSSMAKFNEQMGGIFLLLKQLDGVHFSRELLEPVVQTSLPKTEAETVDLNTKIVANLGHRAFSKTSRLDLYGSNITVSIGDHFETTPEAKADIPWLQKHQQIESMTEPVPSSSSSIQFSTAIDTMVIGQEDDDQLLIKREEEYVEMKRPKREEIANLLNLEEDANSIDDKNAENELHSQIGLNWDTFSKKKDIETSIFVRVQGELVNIEEIDETSITKMSESEKADYYERMQGEYADYY